MEQRTICPTCSGTTLVIVAYKDGYTVYRQCPECRRRWDAEESR